MDKSQLMIIVDSKQLKATMVEVLEARGVHPNTIKDLVGSLINTSLRGVDSHGINIFPYYCRAFDSGRINKQPNINIERPGPAALNVDGDHAMGHHAGVVAMTEAVKVAKEQGVAIASVKNSTHFGAAAYFGLIAAQQDCLGFSFTNADALVKAFSAKESFFGTNPICFTAPLADEEPFCLDMATSQTSWNNILNMRRKNEPLPEGWAFNKEGESVLDPQIAASLSPIGEYKGFGLGMMVEILCSTISGSVNSKDMLAMYSSPIAEKRHVSHFFMAIDISKFLPVDSFKRNLQIMVDRIRKMEKIEGAEDVMVAGDPQKKNYIHRIENGIPILESRFNDFLDLNSDFNKAVIGEKISG